MGDNVFFQGSLQDGIAHALQQSKMVVAFVTDSGDESQTWENELLTNDTLKSPLENQAVVLRLQAGSEEAGFLEALFPVPKKPTIVIIQNGTLKEYIGGGTAKEDLIRRITKSLTPSTTSQSRPAAAPQGRTLGQQGNSLDDLYDDDDTPAPAPVASTSAAPPAPAPAPTYQGQNAQAQAILAERAKRLEADKKAKEAQAKADREARTKQRKEAGDNGETHPNVGAAERSYAEEVRQRKVQATEERKRILRRIEDDKRERREREAQERQARLLLSATQDGEGTGGQGQAQVPPIPLSRRAGGGMGAGGDHCNLQVRLFDGSTLRSRFPSAATLGGDVRAWIDEARTDGDAPYTFRVVLTPLPNKHVEPAEEIRSLLSLGLAPSATLVLVPSKYAAAYARADGVAWRGFASVLRFFAAGYGLLLAMFGAIAGMLPGRGGAQRQDEIPLRGLAARNSRIRGFENPEDQRRDAQLYNGNSLNFEPRRDDEDEDGGSS